MKALTNFVGKLSEKPFRTKLTFITLAVTAVALLMSCLGMIAVQYYYEREDAVSQNRQLAEVLASNLGASVVFGDTATADSITNSASAVPNVLVIKAYDDLGQLVSGYEADHIEPEEADYVEDLVQSALKGGGYTVNNLGTIVTPIAVNGDKVGTLVIGFRYRGLREITTDVAPVALFLFAGCMAIGVAVARLLKNMVFRPLDRLTRSMQTVRQSGNLQDRVLTNKDPDFDPIITSYNAMLDEIEQRNSELANAMAELAVARDDAEEANVSKSAFLANMSHELRTPLNAIIGYAEVLHDDLEQAGLTRSVDDVSWIYASSRQLLELINSLLDLSKIEAGKMELDVHTFDLRKLVAEVEGVLQPLANKQRNILQVTIADDVGMVRSDSTKLRQCLLNLGSNACKFTEEGFVQLAARVEGHELVFDVSDSGIGMSEDEIAKLFQPFVQSDSSTTRRFGGTGLGLALVERFTTMLGGAVTVSSEVGFGSTFTIRILRDMNGATAAQEINGSNTAMHTLPALTTAHHTPRSQPLALIMEDEPSAVELLRRLLDRNGYSCIVAGDGQAGLQMARERDPDIVLLDIGLPKLDGWGVLEVFSDDEHLRAIPTVVVSVDDRKRLSLELGASDHLTKPINTDELDKVLSFYSKPCSGRILLVEDDEATARLYANGLSQCGYEVVQAANGAEAIARLQDNEFSLVVTDLMMPEVDGYELVESIAAIPVENRPSVIVITGATLDAMQTNRIAQSVNSIHLKSGLTPRNLATRISEVLDA